MRVIELIIDGFKSYSVRTVISGWDESFNSITGLNGSGKSNILDAICFVLGITNLSTVRAQNLQDLIYKRGQAGVTKASVTIVFDNIDKSKSPIGFEDYGQISVTRQIVVGGTTKYLINGHRAQQQTVQNLFQSVQLNINSPNFLIMQGRITKVLNMKPIEILAMIEEAAGTRMFEDRRDKALKTMAKKEFKLQEIQGLLRDEIEPKLEKLRQEKRSFLDFQQTQIEVEKLTRIIVAYECKRIEDSVSLFRAEYMAKKTKRDELELLASNLSKEIKLLQKDSKRIEQTREQELRKGGNFEVYEKEVQELSNELVRLNTVINLKKTNLQEELDNKNALQSSIDKLEVFVKQKKQELDKLLENFKNIDEQYSKKKQELESKEELYLSLQTGVSAKDGQDNGYIYQLQKAREMLSHAVTKQEQGKLKLRHLEQKIRDEGPRADKAKEENSHLHEKLQVMREERDGLLEELNEIGSNAVTEENLVSRRSELQKCIRELRAEIDSLKSHLSGIDFTFTNPEPNFDSRRVKGLVAQLFTVSDDYTSASTALEICAGGRLYNVVVDTAATGTLLLRQGKLKKRVTIIPLDKISAYKASKERINTAKSVGRGKVNLALQLVGYDDEVNAAMEYVFGSTLICDDGEIAKQVTFHPGVKIKSITLEGDVYDPMGTLSGGSAPRSSGVLLTLKKLNKLTKRLQEAEEEFEELDETFKREEKRLNKAKELRITLELKEHEIKLGEEQVKTNSWAMIIQGFHDMQDQLEKLKLEMKESVIEQREREKEIGVIEQDIRDFSENKDDKLEEIKRKSEKLKGEVEIIGKTVEPMEREIESLRMEYIQGQGELEAQQEKINENSIVIEEIRAELLRLEGDSEGVSKKHGKAMAKLESEGKQLSRSNDELKELENAIRTKGEKCTSCEVEVMTLKHELEKMKNESEAMSRKLKNLEKEHEWIITEREIFGKRGTFYDFSQYNIEESRGKLQSMRERYAGMKRTINPKVMNMIDNVEKKENGLKSMMRTVVKDKRKIEETIRTLDEYKKEALHKTWQKVNEDFGQIFSEILEGSFAKLVPGEGKEISQGLEVKVCLGNVWKESLAELSGGQRSLIALSLIMALLQFKPAPLYILDEVDAALDLSHTQNIGRLIKTRFRGSQFIVVSLKDGMFQNANCIFRTRFAEGTSVVQVVKSVKC